MNSTLPKILHPIAGKPMVNHVIDQAKKLNPKKIYLIANQELSRRNDFLLPNVEIVIQKNQNGTAIFQTISGNDWMGINPYLLQLALGNISLINLNAEEIRHQKEELKVER